MARIYAAFDHRLLVCERRVDGTVEVGTRLEGRDVECIAGAPGAPDPPGAPDRLFVGTFEDGLFRSTDGGVTFEGLETESVFESEAVTALAVSPHDPAVVYAGTEPSRLYRSTDGGDSWVHLDGLADLPSESEWYFPPRPDTHHVRWVEVDPNDPDRLYVGVEAGAFVLSVDGGESWRERPEGSRRDNHSLATHPDREGRVYSAAGDGYAQSDDGGETWHHPQDGLEHRYCWSVVPDPGDPDAVLLSSARGARTAHTASSAESYVYRRHRDGDEQPGGSWERLDGRGMPTGEGVVRTVFATTTDPGVAYGANNRGIYRSGDFGDDWERLPVEWDEGLETSAPRGLLVIA